VILSIRSFTFLFPLPTLIPKRMAFKEYCRYRRSLFCLEPSYPWITDGPEEARVVIRRLAYTTDLIDALEQLDILFPNLQRARVLNLDAKGSTQWFLFYPNNDPDAPLVRISTSDLQENSDDHAMSFKLYDRAADSIVVQDCNTNLIFDLDDVVGNIPSLSKQVHSLQEFADFLATKPLPPPYTPPASGCLLM